MQGDERGSGLTVFRRDAETGQDVRRAGEDWPTAETITVYLVVSRFPTDHALTYLFCNAATPARVKAFVDTQPQHFRGDNVVVELGERYTSLGQAKQRALGLRSWLSNVNIVFPPLRIG